MRRKRRCPYDFFRPTRGAGSGQSAIGRRIARQRAGRTAQHYHRLEHDPYGSERHIRGYLWEAHEDATVLVSTAIDESLGDDLRVAFIATMGGE